MVTSTEERARRDAAKAGLTYSQDDGPGIRRRKRGTGWSFRAADGRTVGGTDRKRCLGLAIPPAYRDVWICPDPRGHLQATARDARGRKVYIYHDEWRRFRDTKKFSHLRGFGETLGEARARNDAKRRGGEPRQGRILAALFWLLDHHALRVGNETYTEENGSFGATTLRHRHLEGDGTILHFPAKGGREQEIELHDRRLRHLMRRLSELPGQHLFQYRNESGELRHLTSGEVNAYLHGLFGESVTAKTFRTWHGSVEAFARGLEAGARIDDILEAASSRLGNTKAIARNSYVHPRIIAEVKDGSLSERATELRRGRVRSGLSPEETWFMRWLG